MAEFNIYDDISKRTNGDVYIGVVGPVRTGKSTFIKRFMDLLVLPNIENAYKRERARDELPQSASGRTIMTTEPKFIPEEAVEITVDKGAAFRAKMIDCVGYVIPGALGHTEKDRPRMVATPWEDMDIPFVEAAELGTKKVITDHSTIGLMVTTDGSISDIPREEYIEAEERVAGELSGINKPYVILLNSTRPRASEVQLMAEELKTKYGVPVLAVNCAEMELSHINSIMQSVLFEFPVSEISFYLPPWADSLPADHPLKKSVYSTLTDASCDADKISRVYKAVAEIGGDEQINSVSITHADLGTGKISAKVQMPQGLFYSVLSEQCGCEIKDEYGLVTTLSRLTAIKRRYDKIESALSEVERTGYGIVSPSTEELTLQEPKIVKQGSRFGVRLRASAPSIHIICNKPKSLEAA